VVNTVESSDPEHGTDNAIKVRFQQLRHAGPAIVSATKFRSKFCLIFFYRYEKMRTVAPDLPDQFSIAFNIAFQEEP
jgi:hypothetical protein